MWVGGGLRYRRHILSTIYQTTKNPNENVQYFTASLACDTDSIEKNMNRRIYFCTEMYVGGKCSILNLILWVYKRRRITSNGTFCQLFNEPQKPNEKVLNYVQYSRSQYRFYWTNLWMEDVFLYRDVCGWEMFDIKSIFMCVQEEEDYTIWHILSTIYQTTKNLLRTYSSLPLH